MRISGKYLLVHRDGGALAAHLLAWCGLLIIAAAAFGLVYALGTVAISMLTRDAFGVINYGRTYPTMSLSGNIANVVFSSIVGFMYDFSSGYTLTLVVFIVLLAIAGASVVFVYTRAPRTARAELISRHASSSPRPSDQWCRVLHQDGLQQSSRWHLCQM